MSSVGSYSSSPLLTIPMVLANKQLSAVSPPCLSEVGDLSCLSAPGVIPVFSVEKRHPCGGTYILQHLYKSVYKSFLPFSVL